MNQLAVSIRALGLPGNTEVEPLVDGASAAAWRVRAKGVSFVLRASGSSQLMDGRLSAMYAARCAGLPAPDLVKRTSTEFGDAVLLTWLGGNTLMEVVTRNPAQARFWGRRMGLLQRRLHEIEGPPSLGDVLTDSSHPFNAGLDVAGLPDGDSLLHLDWHPLNLLVDESSNELSGIIDWDNARRGHPLLDLARTKSILSVDPAVRALAPALREVVDEMARAWEEGYGSEASSIPAACHVWAGQVMLADLGPRYSEETLAPVRTWIKDWSDQLP